MKEAVGDNTVGVDAPAAKAVRFDDEPTLHVEPAPPPAPPAAVPYTGADVRRHPPRHPPQESVVTEPEDQDKWVYGGRVAWWQSNAEWASR